MNALVLFRSYYGNTKQIADAIAQQISALGHTSAVQDIRQKLPDLTNVDFMLIGAPTRMARVNRKALTVLKQLCAKGFLKKPLAIFDTYGPLPSKPDKPEKSEKWLYPGAAGIMQKAAVALGLQVYNNLLRCEVKGLKGPLAENELERAASFTSEFVSSIG